MESSKKIFKIAITAQIGLICVLSLCLIVAIHFRDRGQVEQASHLQATTVKLQERVSLSENEQTPPLLLEPETEIPAQNTASQVADTEIGLASYYSDLFQGHRTANGDIYDVNEFTGAHRTYAFGTQVRVTNVQNQKSVVVRINDRGPHKQERIIDLSGRAAKIIGLQQAGVAKVKLEALL